MRFKAKQYVFMISFLTVVMLFSVSGASQDQLTLWGNAGAMPKLELFAEMFARDNSQVKFETQTIAGSQTAVMERLLVGIASKSAPDVAWLEGSAVIEFAVNGMLMDLTDTLAGLRFTPADTTEMTYDGRLWGVPYQTSLRGLFKRSDFFHEAGMNPTVDPASLDELYAWNVKLTKVDADGKFTRAGLVPWVGNWGAPGWIWTFGGQLMETEGRELKPTANHPQNVAAFEWLREWRQFYGTASPVAAGARGFSQGSVAMSTESTSSVGVFLQDGVAFATGEVPHPSGGQNGTWGGPVAAGVPVGIANVEWAHRFIRFMGSADAQVEAFQVLPAGIPGNWDALVRVSRTLPAEYAPLFDQFPQARPRTPLWLDYYPGNLTPAMNDMLAGKKTAEQALNDVQKRMESLFAELFSK